MPTPVTRIGKYCFDWDLRNFGQDTLPIYRARIFDRPLEEVDTIEPNPAAFIHAFGEPENVALFPRTFQAILDSFSNPNSNAGIIHVLSRDPNDVLPERFKIMKPDRFGFPTGIAIEKPEFAGTFAYEKADFNFGEHDVISLDDEFIIILKQHPQHERMIFWAVHVEALDCGADELDKLATFLTESVEPGPMPVALDLGKELRTRIAKTTSPEMHYFVDHILPFRNVSDSIPDIRERLGIPA